MTTRTFVRRTDNLSELVHEPGDLHYECTPLSGECSSWQALNPYYSAGAGSKVSMNDRGSKPAKPA